MTAYLKSVVDAYRSSDEQIVDPLVSEQQGLKLLGLIGVKRDADVYLDAQLLEIRFDQVEPARDRIEVLTHERWHYVDRKIGSGAQVGEDSTDAYAMRYLFIRKGGKWLLDELSFGEPPQVGRKIVPGPLDRRAAHGLPPPDDATGPAAPAAAPEKR